MKQNGNVRHGDPYTPKISFMAPNTAAVAAAPPALNTNVGVEWTKKTPIAIDVNAELNPHRPEAISLPDAPRHAPVKAPIAEPVTACAARPGLYVAIPPAAMTAPANADSTTKIWDIPVNGDAMMSIIPVDVGAGVGPGGIATTLSANDEKNSVSFSITAISVLSGGSSGRVRSNDVNVTILKAIIELTVKWCFKQIVRLMIRTVQILENQ